MKADVLTGPRSLRCSPESGPVCQLSISVVTDTGSRDSKAGGCVGQLDKRVHWAMVVGCRLTLKTQRTLFFSKSRGDFVRSWGQ